jgi:predicted enzyme related to lactoylglutathione lyase
MHLQRSSNPLATSRRSCRKLQCFLEHSLLALLLSLAGAELAAAAPPVLPALVTPASQEHHLGKVIFAQLVTPDLAAAEQFYAGLFGWTFRSLHGGTTDYAAAFFDGRLVAALTQRKLSSAEHRQPAWLTFIAVHDVDATKNAAVQHGAKVLFGPHDFPDRGREAVLEDPQGAVFAVLASSSGDPPDVLAAPGEWIWSSLITREPDVDAGFYQTLFDYEVFDLPAEAGAQHLLLATDNYARASANSLPVSKSNIHPHWLNYVRVEDVDKSAAKAVALGGRILVEPRIDRHGGKIALIADPAGAPFGLLEWPETESKEVSK